MKKSIFIITMFFISLIGVIHVSGQGVIEDGQPKCKGTYTESCGPGQERLVKCGPNGEFMTDPCLPIEGASESKCEQEGQCPVATVWEESICKCRGTAEGTSKETVETTPRPNGGEIVAARKDEPREISRIEGNDRRVSKGGGSSGGGGSNNGGGNNGNLTINPNACTRNQLDNCFAQGSGVANTESVTCENPDLPAGTDFTIECCASGFHREGGSCVGGEFSECPAGENRCWVYSGDSCTASPSCMTQDACNVLGVSVGNSTTQSFWQSERPGICQLQSNTLDTQTTGAQSVSICRSICPNVEVSGVLNPGEETITCTTNSGDEYTATNGNLNGTCPAPATQPQISGVTIEVPAGAVLCNSINGISKKVPTDNINSMRSPDGTCFDPSINGFVAYCTGHSEQTGPNGTIFDCGADTPGDIDIERLENLPLCPAGAECDRAQSDNANCALNGQFFFCPEVESNVLGASTSQTLDEGVYSISSDGVNSVDVVIATENVELKVFVDTNGDGVKQKNEEYIENNQIKISTTTEITNYSFDLGWNLLGFDLISGEWDSAKKLINVLEDQGIIITHITTYTAGQWASFSIRTDEEDNRVEFGTNFTIVPGQSYFLKAENSGNASLSGNKFLQSVPLNISNGWNLVSVQSVDDYDAEKLLSRCESAGINCDSLAKYSSGLYEVVVRQNGILFGNNFNLLRTSGYFLRVKSGGGSTLTP